MTLPSTDRGLMPDPAERVVATYQTQLDTLASTASLSLVLGSTVAVNAGFKPTAWTLVLSLGAGVIGGRLGGFGLVESASLVLIALTGWLVRADLSGLPAWSLATGLLATAICFVPLATWRNGHPDRFPLLGLFGAVQGVYLYVGTLVAQPSLPYQSIYPLRVREVGLEASLVYVTVLVGAGLAVRRLPIALSKLRERTSASETAANPSAMAGRALALIVIGIAVYFYLPASLNGSLGAIPQVIGLARIAGIAVLAALWARGQLNSVQKLATVLAVAFDALSGASGAAALYSSVGGLIAALSVIALRRARVALWLMMVLIPLSIAFNVAKTEVRQTPTKPSGHLASASLLVADAWKATTHPQRSTLTASADRFDNSEVLGYVAVHVPRDYPYWNKESYTELPLVIVPRVLAPFKPKDTLANQFGRRYGLLSPSDHVTSANTPIQVEAWANFGAVGLVGIGGLVGILLGLGEGWFRPDRLDGLVLGIVVAYEAIGGIESGIDSFALTVPTVIIFIPVVRWALHVRRHNGPARTGMT